MRALATYAKFSPLHTDISCLLQLLLPVVNLSGYLDSALEPHPGIGMIVYGEK